MTTPNDDELAAQVRHHHEELKRELAEIDADIARKARLRTTEWPQFEQDNTGEWVARAKCGHIGNPEEMSDDGLLCVNCAQREEAKK